MPSKKSRRIPVLQKMVKRHFHTAGRCASREVLRLARKALRDHAELNEFVMSMGGWFFTLKIGEMDKMGLAVTPGNDIIHDCSDDPRFKDIEAFISEWDLDLHITGEPMRFTATGPIRTDW